MELSPEAQEAANAAAAALTIGQYIRNHVYPLLIGGGLAVGGFATVEKFFYHPADHNDAVASHTNEAKVIASNDSTREDLKMVVGAVGNLVAMVSNLQNQVGIITLDLQHSPEIMRIDKARRDSIYRANRPGAFSFNQ